MFSEFIRARLWLGLAAVALTGGGHAASIFDIQAAEQTAAPSWLETLVLGGPPQDGVLAVRDDRDYFRMNVTEPTMAAIYTNTGGVQTRLRLYDPEGGLIARGFYGGEQGNSRIEAILPRRGTYYVTVEYWDFIRGSIQAPSYAVHAERAAWPAVLTLGGSPQESVISKVDYFQLQVTEPAVAAIYTTGALDLIGTLLDPDGREIASDDDGGDGNNFRIEALLARRGTYYLRVEGAYSSTGSYNLHAERLASPAALMLGGPPQEGAIERPGGVDWFWLQVAEEAGPTAVAIYTTGGLISIGTLLDSGGREIERDFLGGSGLNFRIETVLWDPGTYILNVETPTWADPGSYTLHAERGESPGRLTLGGPPQEGATVLFGIDQYFLDVSGPTRAAIYTTGGIDTEATLFDPDDRRIASDDNGGDGLNFRIESLLLRRGRYRLRLVAYGDDLQGGSYTLHAERGGGLRALSLGGLPQQGAILSDGEADNFLMDITGPTSVAIHTSGGVDTGGELYDPEGGLVAWDDDGGEGNNFRIDTVLLRRGTYLLRIVSSHPDSTGSYTLHATAER